MAQCFRELPNLPMWWFGVAFASFLRTTTGGHPAAQKGKTGCR